MSLLPEQEVVSEREETADFFLILASEISHLDSI